MPSCSSRSFSSRSFLDLNVVNLTIPTPRTSHQSQLLCLHAGILMCCIIRCPDDLAWVHLDAWSHSSRCQPSFLAFAANARCMGKVVLPKGQVCYQQFDPIKLSQLWQQSCLVDKSMLLFAAVVVCRACELQLKASATLHAWQSMVRMNEGAECADN